METIDPTAPFWTVWRKTDETEFAVALNDVDFCLKLGQAGYRNVVTSDVRAIHHESVSRGKDLGGQAGKRFEQETDALRTKWASLFSDGDPFYNRNLSLDSEDYRLNWS